MAYAFAFPGQGSQKIGMGKDLYAAFPEAARRFQEADDVAGRSISSLCFEGPEEKLRSTENTQPALFTVEAIIADILVQRGIIPVLTLGHSLGEYAALYAAGFFSFADGLKIVLERGRLMARAGEYSQGAMAAIVGLAPEAIRAQLEKIMSGIVVAANENAPDQTVISGEKTAVALAAEALKTAGAKRVVPLAVSGAFHSPLMKPAADEFAAFLEKMHFSPPRCPVVSNVTAAEESDPARVKNLLVRQLVSPVRWIDCVSVLGRHADATCIEAGPGAVLRGLIRRIDGSISVLSCESVENIYSLTNS